MRERLRRSVLVDAPLEVAWNYLAEPERWPKTWAGHIRRVECDPPGAITATTTGVIKMKAGFKSSMRMTEFQPGRTWKWIGRGRIGPTTSFDHQFKALDRDRTRIDFVVETEGFLEPLFGRITGRYLGRQLDRNLPRLVAQLNQIGWEQKI